MSSKPPTLDEILSYCHDKGDDTRAPCRATWGSNTAKDCDCDVADAKAAILSAIRDAKPEKVDMSKYEGIHDDGIDISLSDNDDSNGDMLAHLAQYASDKTHNEAVDEYESNLIKWIEGTK